MNLNNVAAGIDCFLVVRVENVEEEWNAASLQNVFDNFFTLFADLTDATENKILIVIKNREILNWICVAAIYKSTI